MNLNSRIRSPFLGREVALMNPHRLKSMIDVSLTQTDSIRIPFGEIVASGERATKDTKEIVDFLEQRGYSCEVHDELVGISPEGDVSEYQRYIYVERKGDGI